LENAAEMANADCQRSSWAELQSKWQREFARVSDGGWWSAEPDVGRVAHGVPSRMDRLRCLGNAVVPHVAEVIGRYIVTKEDEWKPSSTAG
jgi:DNA (cytosine-5)-methyltransferase 1